MTTDSRLEKLCTPLINTVEAALMDQAKVCLSSPSNLLDVLYKFISGKEGGYLTIVSCPESPGGI